MTSERGGKFRNDLPSVVRVGAVIFAVLLCLAADGSRLKHVPEADRKRVDPLAGQPDAVAAGSILFADHCAKCHGTNALGKGKRPSLRSDLVQHATDGELFWVLRNGVLSKGMPSWSALPEASRWQIIDYIKSLGPANTHATEGQGKTK
ncbi:MAG: c-type cytochrome [Candidatus Acidiferrales bacterium]